MANRETAYDEQFVLLPQCFKLSFVADVSEWVHMFERAKWSRNL